MSTCCPEMTLSTPLSYRSPSCLQTFCLQNTHSRLFNTLHRSQKTASNIDGWSPQRQNHSTIYSTLLTSLSTTIPILFVKIPGWLLPLIKAVFLSAWMEPFYCVFDLQVSLSFPSLLSYPATSGLRTCFGDLAYPRHPTLVLGWCHICLYFLIIRNIISAASRQTPPCSVSAC